MCSHSRELYIRGMTSDRQQCAERQTYVHGMLAVSSFPRTILCVPVELSVSLRSAGQKRLTEHILRRISESKEGFELAQNRSKRLRAERL
jgi:hypothetical protein